MNTNTLEKILGNAISLRMIAHGKKWVFVVVFLSFQDDHM
jgi:hypothetical protein